MGDTYFTFIPADPQLLPQKNMQELASEYIQNLLCPEEIKVMVTPKPQLIIGGEIDHILICPSCDSAKHTDEYFECIREAYSENGFDLDVMSPCCKTTINFSDLEFTYPEDVGDEFVKTGGFARFQIDCLNPQREVNSIELEEISKIMGCDALLVIRYF